MSDTQSNQVNIETVKNYLLDLQADICRQLAAEDGSKDFIVDQWEREPGQGEMGLTGGGISRVLEGGDVIEKGRCEFFACTGQNLAGFRYRASSGISGALFSGFGVSLVIHPRNPYVPTSHANVRLFVAEKKVKHRFGGLAVALI